jgi:HTH-type transcriptional regulator / antitoxin HipB
MNHRTHTQVMAEALKDREFKAIWEANAVKRELTSAIIGERIKRKLSQAQLAAKAGLKQPSLARVEGGGVMPSVATLMKLAQAFGKKLVIRFA